MAKPHSHLLDIYSCWLHVAIDAKQWKRLRRRLPSLPKEPGGIEATDLTVHIHDAGYHEPHVTIFIDVAAHEGSQLALIETCAHEAAHAAGAILDHVEADYQGSSEPHAYLVGWITQWLWRTVEPAK